MKGRKPKPAALKALEGDDSAPNCPTPPATLPKPPPSLSPPAKKLWKRWGPKFAALGIMAEVDEAAFAMLCESYSQWILLIELARNDGPIVKVNGQPVPNPYLVRADKEAEKVRKMMAEFGGSPASRTRLIGPGAGGTGPEDDPMAALLDE